MFVAATEFCRNFATYQRQVQREPIEVRSHDKVTGYYVSSETFERIATIGSVELATKRTE